MVSSSAAAIVHFPGWKIVVVVVVVVVVVFCVYALWRPSESRLWRGTRKEEMIFPRFSPFHRSSSSRHPVVVAVVLLFLVLVVVVSVVLICFHPLSLA